MNEYLPDLRMENESRQPKQATEFTKRENKAFKNTLPSDDGTDAANVAKGFIATRTNPIIEKHEPNAWQPISWAVSYTHLTLPTTPYV